MDPLASFRRQKGALGAPLSARVEAPANANQRRRLAQLRPDELSQKQLAGESISLVLDRAPGNGAPIGGIKVVAPGGWFAARPSGTEDLYKIYAESDRDEAHLGSILREAQAIVDAALAKA